MKTNLEKPVSDHWNKNLQAPNKKTSAQKTDQDLSNKLADLSLKMGKRLHTEHDNSGYDSLDEVIKRQKSK